MGSIDADLILAIDAILQKHAGTELTHADIVPSMLMVAHQMLIFNERGWQKWAVDAAKMQEVAA